MLELCILYWSHKKIRNSKKTLQVVYNQWVLCPVHGACIPKFLKRINLCCQTGWNLPRSSPSHSSNCNFLIFWYSLKRLLNYSAASIRVSETARWTFLDPAHKVASGRCIIDYLSCSVKSPSLSWIGRLAFATLDVEAAVGHGVAASFLINYSASSIGCPSASSSARSCLACKAEKTDW